MCPSKDQTANDLEITIRSSIFFAEDGIAIMWNSANAEQEEVGSR